MKTLTIREACKSLSHPEQMFADTNEVLVVCRGEPVVRLLPVKPKMRMPSLTAFRARQPRQTVPSEVVVGEDRSDRF